ncbi:MAG: hypothetical protein LBG31_03120 [Prevotellaceae bacterium]|nr:hypothetical protein [Prevotellaceae bacterium]
MYFTGSDGQFRSSGMDTPGHRVWTSPVIGYGHPRSSGMDIPGHRVWTSPIVGAVGSSSSSRQ